MAIKFRKPMAPPTKAFRDASKYDRNRDGRYRHDGQRYPLCEDCGQQLSEADFSRGACSCNKDVPNDW